MTVTTIPSMTAGPPVTPVIPSSSPAPTVPHAIEIYNHVALSHGGLAFTGTDKLQLLAWSGGLLVSIGLGMLWGHKDRKENNA